MAPYTKLWMSGVAVKLPIQP